MQLITQPRNLETTVTFYFPFSRNTTSLTYYVLLQPVSPLSLIPVSSGLYRVKGHLGITLSNPSPSRPLPVVQNAVRQALARETRLFVI